MCQLTFTNLGSAIFNSNYLVIQSFINTRTDHKDGFGIFSDAIGLKKTIVAPSNCTNLGTFIGKLDKEPVISHVRKATYTNNVKTVSEDKSHPFETDKLVLAHNGTLELKSNSEFSKGDYKDLIDSEIFLKVLDSFYDGKVTMLEALEKAYREFNGKFAFLIYSKLTKEFFVARGETAKLHKRSVTIGGKSIGFVVNTDKDDLDDAFLLFRNLMLLKGVKIDWVENTVELEQNSVFRLDKKSNDLVRIGALVETKKYVPATIVATPTVKSNNSNYWDRQKENKVKKEDKVFLDLFNLCVQWKISIKYLDELLWHTIGKPLLSCEEIDIKLFLDEFVPSMKGWGTGKNIGKEWGKIQPNLKTGDLDFHNVNGIQFPYILETDIGKLRDIRRYGSDKHFM